MGVALGVGLALGFGGRRSPLVFSAPLTHSLALAKGVGSATFSRSTGGTVVDHEGLARTCLPEEARFQRARRVENLERSVVTVLVGAAANTLQSGVTYLLEGLSYLNSDRMTKNWLDATNVANRSFRLSFEVMAPSGQEGKRVISRFRNGVSGSPDVDSSVVLTLTESWVRYSQITTLASDTLSDGVGWWLYGSVTDTATSVLYRNVQCEDITGRANQSPSEYVSAGLLAAPYHGANVDGVKYFNTTNPNEVDANGVVTTTAAVTPLIPDGILIEESRTNYFLNSDAPANQNIDVTATGTGDYVITMTGTGSIDLTSGGAVWTGPTSVTEATPAIITVTTAGIITLTMVGDVQTVQFEQGAFPTSYIQTAGGSVTRTADNCYYDSANIPTSSVFTIVGEAALGQASDFTSPTYLLGSYKNATAFDCVRVELVSTTTVRAVVRAGGATKTHDTIIPAVAIGDRIKFALRLNGSELAGTAQGVAVGAPTIGVQALDYAALDNLSIGAYRDVVDAEKSNASLSNVHIYKRALSDAKMQELTA